MARPLAFSGRIKGKQPGNIMIEYIIIHVGVWGRQTDLVTLALNLDVDSSCYTKEESFSMILT